ncbi:SAP domain-containing protein [Mycena venus]|uniref:SAP domain-containing protein n=1 Tax=Mycena venus TaxID=2733690 RepID=A0A8H6XKH2_9AGAR|nr:SAP domain-containing protein [Mycena venus]
MSTTQILFNSPALHSLKRDQLVKLCKIHSIKANGKNVELIERLKSHAKSLPKDDPLSVAIRSEQEDAPAAQDDEEEAQEEKVFNPRPSSQWELVMDSIMEEPENSSHGGSSQGTLSSLKSSATLTGEFGTGSNTSKSTLTVSSSIRALASSFGLKRHATNGSTTSSKLLSSFPLPPPSDVTADELLKNSTPYDALPPPSLADLQTDHFTFDTTDPAVVAANLNPTLGTAPLPGHTLRPGVPAPANARLSLGLAPRTPSKQGPTTTIRLVSFGSSANPAALAAKLPPPGDTPNLKPFKTTFDLDLGSPTAAPIEFPASLYPALPASPPMDDTERRISLEASTSMRADAEPEDEDVPMPGAFATPPKTPKPAFVFGSPSPQPAAFSFSMPSASPDAATKAKLAAEVLEEMNRRVFGEGGVPPTPPRIMRPLPGSARKDESSGSGAKGRFDKAHEQVFGRMESIADVAARREQLKRKSSAVSVGGRAAAAAAEEDEPRQGKRVRMDDDGKGKDDAEAEAERKQKEKEKEAIRRKLEISRARRRSSAAAGGARRASGRVSGAGVLVKPKPTAASRGRFGFFAGAAKLVQGVWGGGKKTAATQAPKPVPAAAATAASSSSLSTTAANTNTNVKPAVSKMAPPPPPPPIPSSASANKSLRPPSMRSVASTRSTAAGRARSPLPPSFAPSTASSKSTMSSARTRNSSIAGASSVGTRTSSAAGSMGTRNSLRVGSLGTRGSISSTNTPSSTVDSARKSGTGTGGRPSSRLLAPTASSLAKMNGGGSSPGPLAAVQERQDSKVLDAITNTADADAGSVTGTGTARGKGKGKLLPAPARKPRISRSRVIAKLASQRVASGSSIASAGTAGSARKSLGGGRARSSLGAKVAGRGSFAGMKNASHGPGAVLDAKKRARQSEYYARRKTLSRVVDTEPAPTANADAMQVDS